MENMAPFVLGLVTAEGTPAGDPNCRVEFLRLDGVCILRADRLEFPPKHAFNLPAFPQARNLHCTLTPSLYRIVQSEFFTLTDSQRMEKDALVLRRA